MRFRTIIHQQRRRLSHREGRVEGVDVERLAVGGGAIMQKKTGEGARGFMVRLSIIQLALSLFSMVAGADFPQLEGPTFPPGDMGVPGESIGDQEDADIAAGGAGFLVVWTDMRTSYKNSQGLDQTGRDVYAARLDSSGNLIDTTPIVVSQEVGSQQEPEVAWNGQHWLVVWENETPPARALLP